MTEWFMLRLSDVLSVTSLKSTNSLYLTIQRLSLRVDTCRPWKTTVTVVQMYHSGQSVYLCPFLSISISDVVLTV